MDYSSKETMSCGVVNPPESFPIEEFSSPLSAQIFELCDSELFSEVNSSSNCCYDANSSYTQNFNSFLPNTLEKNGNTNTTTTTTSTANSSATPVANTTTNNSNLSVIFDSPERQENDISATIDYSSFSGPQIFSTTNNNQQNQFDFSSIPSQNALQFPSDPPNLSLVGPPLPSVYEDECLSFMPPSMRLNPNSSGSNSFLESTMGSYFQGNLSNAISADNTGIFIGGMYMNNNNEIQIQDLDYQGDNGGIFCPENLPRIYNSNELQAQSNESQHVVNGGGSTTPLASDLSSLDDSTFKVRKLSAEERKEKIHRYMKKRNERNFSKKIKYACRKTLADSRPRVRGRFAKNDELLSATCCNHEDDVTDEDSLPIVVKEEEEMFDSSDIFAHISGVNSFKCSSYPIQSWI